MTSDESGVDATQAYRCDHHNVRTNSWRLMKSHLEREHADEIEVLARD